MDRLNPIFARYGDRVTVRRTGALDPNARCVVYWVLHAQRALDNPALDLAVDIANALGLPVVAFFGLVPYYPKANLRHFRFVQQGIPDIAADCAHRNIGFVLRRYPEESLINFCIETNAALVVGDEDPLRETEAWRDKAAKKLRIPLVTVDADVIVPTRLLLKEQYSARIIRPRLRRHFEQYLVAPSNPVARVPWNPPPSLHSLAPEFDITANWRDLDTSAQPVDTFRGGTHEALRLLREFVSHKLARYPERHNRPEYDGTSRLSPYLNRGQISPHTVALAVQQADAPQSAKDDFLDQLITWRELAINFVHFNPLYDSIECAPDWAHRTLATHSRDRRPVVYSRDQLEQAATHDDLWNAAQRQGIHAGWMHNYMRMYWAKKILEWSPSPAVAYQTAVYLNDKYFLDGGDPNGYAGIAWSIAGKFDRPWFDRPVFGTVRYMSGPAAEKKFDTHRYIEQVSSLVE